MMGRNDTDMCDQTVSIKSTASSVWTMKFADRLQTGKVEDTWVGTCDFLHFLYVCVL
jgi:hypothetical protein